MSTFEAKNPCTNQTYKVFNTSSQEEISEKVALARAVFKKWRKTSRVYRSDLFDKLAQLLKGEVVQFQQAIMMETGKGANEAYAEVIEALHMCQLTASMGRQPYGEIYGSEIDSKDAYVVRKPRGVVAIISPWNFPLAIGSFWCAGPAILEGNTVVHKPSELTPLVNEMAYNLYLKAGFPEGVFSLVQGDGEVGKQLVASNVDVILFTGSPEVAKEIKLHCAASAYKTCSVEAGSKSATMIFNDCDYELALHVSLASAFKLSGQRCVSSGRILVQRDLFEQFCADFAGEVSNSVRVMTPSLHKDLELTHYGSVENERVCFGPMISAEHKERVLAWNRMVCADPDVTVLHDLDSFGLIESAGHFLRPFVYRCEWADKPFLKNEVFGPHVALIPFNDIDDAIRIYNDTDYGLALGVLTDDFRKHRRIAQECDTGMLYINGGSIAAESHLPFNSWKASGFGSSAAGTWKAVTHTMSVTVNYMEGGIGWAQGMK